MSGRSLGPPDRRAYAHMMLGAIILVIAMLLIPIAVLMTGAAASAILGEVFRRDGERRHEGSELLDIPD